MMKKVKAAKSASDISLRKGATGAAATRSAFPTLRKSNTWAPTKKGKGKGKGGDSADKPISTNPKKVKSTRTKKEKEVDYDSLTLVELKEMAKKKDLKGYSQLKKSELIDKLKE